MRDNAGPCSHGHVCTATCANIDHHMRSIEFTSSSEVKQILRDEIEDLRCEDLTLDEVFGVTQMVHKKYCCREGREEMEEEFYYPQQNTFVGELSVGGTSCLYFVPPLGSGCLWTLAGVLVLQHFVIN